MKPVTMCAPDGSVRYVPPALLDRARALGYKVCGYQCGGGCREADFKNRQRHAGGPTLRQEAQRPTAWRRVLRWLARLF